MDLHWVEERKACCASGVSPSTLQRFAEAGYLKTKQAQSGLLYDPTELAQVFGIQVSPALEDEAQPLNTATPVAEPLPQTSAPEHVPEDSVKEKIVTLDNPLPDFVPGVGLASKIEIERQPPVTHQQPIQEQRTNAQFDAELQRQKLLGVIDMQEKLLQMRDAQIEDLKKRESWLQERVQRMEEKADRDQLLLLAETQTLRRMIEVQAPKRSLMERALSVMGLLPAPEEKSKEDNRKTVEQ